MIEPNNKTKKSNPDIPADSSEANTVLADLQKTTSWMADVQK